MLGFVNRLSGEFRDPKTFWILYVSLVRPKLEYASCVCSLFIAYMSIGFNVCRESSLDTRCEDWDGRTPM
jgi:hypothetical protein